MAATRKDIRRKLVDLVVTCGWIGSYVVGQDNTVDTLTLESGGCREITERLGDSRA